MALDRSVTYPGFFDNPTSTRPQGAFKNETSEGAEDGSYLDKDWMNDMCGLIDAILVEADESPNGSIDEGGNSQIFEALQKTRQAANIVKASRPVIEGSTGDALPVISVDTVYADGAEIAFGLFADGSVTLQLDANDNIIQTGGTGTVYTEIDIASGLTLTDYYYSIMYNDGSGFVQIYGDGTNGITLSEPVTGTARLDMDLNTLTDGVAVYGISEQLGRLPILSTESIYDEVRSDFILITGASGFAHVYDTYVEQWISGSGDTTTNGASNDWIVDPPSIDDDLKVIVSASGTGSPTGAMKFRRDTSTTTDCKISSGSASVSSCDIYAIFRIV